eukprot:5144511-Amphidinium_carterae.1
MSGTVPKLSLLLRTCLVLNKKRLLVSEQNFNFLNKHDKDDRSQCCWMGKNRGRRLPMVA